MAHSVLNIELDNNDKEYFEEFCSRVGLNSAVAVKMFIKSVINEQKLPFEVKSDPFYSPSNIAKIEKAADQLRRGEGTEHELLDAE